jgi:hypothetical protein
MATMTRTALEAMLDELESHQLSVVLVPLNPAQRGWNEYGMKRVVADSNCKWYRIWCSKNPSKRGIRRGKFDTLIKRFRTVNALRAMIRGEKSTYHREQLLEIAKVHKSEYR